MSLEDKIERLNQNIEALIGAIIANGVAAKATNNIDVTSTDGPATAAATATPAKDVGGRPKTRYWKLSTGAVVKSSSKDAPNSEAVEITKAEYEAGINTPSKPAAAAAEADPFGETAAPAAKTYTLDDVRTVALKLRDTTSQETAKAFIATFGVASLKDLPEAKFAEFVAACEKKLAEASL